MKAEIFPLEKVVINDVSVFFGMEQAAIEAVIGKGQLIGQRNYYFHQEVAIDYIENKVAYIEFLGGTDGAFKPIIYGVSAFDCHAQALVDILKEQNNGEICDMEGGYSYHFSNISIGVYREAIPEEIAEMIKEAASFGNPMCPDEIEYENKKANHFATIGAGCAGYFQQS